VNIHRNDEQSQKIASSKTGIQPTIDSIEILGLFFMSFTLET